MDIAAETETRFELSFGLCRGIMQVVVLLVFALGYLEKLKR